MKKLAIICTHPIQYYVPWFRMLSEKHPGKIKVFYTRSEFSQEVTDKDFGKKIVWDLPLTDGYDFQWCENTAMVREGGFRQVVNPTLISDIEAWGAEAVLVFGWSYQSHLQAMRYFYGRIPVLFRGDSTLLDEKRFSPKTLLRRLWLKWVYFHVDYFLYVGENNRQYFIRHGALANQLVFTPHAVDNERFADPVHDDFSRKMRAELGFHDQDIVIGYLGKFSPKKSVIKLIEAFQNAQKNTSVSLKLLLVGNGSEEEKLKNLSKNSPDITFLPFQNQQHIPGVYRCCDVIVLPSVYGETWGLAVNEAMACGRPVIVSDKVGCAADLVKPGETGWIFPAGSLEALAAILLKLDQDKLAVMGKNAAANIASWNFTKICEGIEKVCSLNGKKILSLFGNVCGPYGQELMAMRTMSALMEQHYELLALVNAEAFHLALKPYVEARHIPYQKLFYTWFGTVTRRPWRIPLIIFQYLAQNVGFCYYLRRYKPDYVLTNNFSPILYLFWTILFSRKIKFVLHLHEKPLARFFWQRWVWKKLMPFKKFKVICVSKYIENQVKAVSPQMDTTVLFNCIPMDADDNITVAAVPPVAVSYWGQLSSPKGVDVLIDAAIILCPKYPELVFNLAGNGVEAFVQAQKRKIAEHHLENRIRFWGYLKEMTSFFARTNLHVLPSVFEDPMPLVTFEAKFHGFPTVAFPSGGIPELITHQKDGYLCKNKSVEALCEGLEYFLKEPERIRSCGSAAKDSLHQLKVTPEDFSQKLAEIFAVLQHD